MLVYWSLFFWALIIGTLYSLSPRNVYIGEIIEQRPQLIHMIIGFTPIILIAGLKGPGIIDSGAYIRSFEAAQFSLRDMVIDWESKNIGFDILEVAFKQFISTDYIVWFFFIALISCIGVMIPLYKYSPLFGLSLFLFIGSADFTWLLNGIRQFLVVAILFGFMDLIVERKHLYYIILVLILSTIHFTALLALPVYLLIVLSSSFKNSIIQMLVPVSLFVIITFIVENIEPVATLFLGSTPYADIYQTALTYEGVNIYRVLVAAIPILLAFMNWNRISKLMTPEINLCIIMSVINFGVLLVASTVGGNLFGRVSIFFAIYNLIALPWLIIYCFNEKSAQIVIFLCVIFYGYWFYYQMVVTWNLPYTSEYLGIYLLN